MSMIISTIGAVAQTAKILYDYYDTHKRNKQLLDILEGFSSNLETALERLQAREELLLGKANPALESIRKDFENSDAWLRTNDKNLRSVWTALQAADKLQDLDNRLTKAFASKMSVAIFTALQDTNAATTKIQSTLDGMQINLEVAVREASREGLQEAIRELKEEAWALRGGKGTTHGFTNGEAEKIISQLVDKLSAQEQLRGEEEELRLHSSGYQIPTPSYELRTITPYSARHPSSLYPTPATDPSFNSNGHSLPDGDSQASFPSRSSSTDLRSRKGKRKEKSGIPAGSILFSPSDPLTNEDLIDPVLANDGIIHDRWTLINATHPNARDPAEPLVIVGDLVQLRLAIFASYPERRLLYSTSRAKYREDTLTLYEEGSHNQLPEIINRLSHILLWEPLSVSLRIRRGIARYRLRDLGGSLEDLNKAVDLSKKGPQGEDKYLPDLDALRARAMVKGELQDNSAALEDLEAVLKRSENDVLALALRSGLRGNAGDLSGAQDDLALTNMAISSDKAYRSAIGDSDVSDKDRLGIRPRRAPTSPTPSTCEAAAQNLTPWVACLALAKTTEGLKIGQTTLVLEGQNELMQAISLVRAFAVANLPDGKLKRYSSGTKVVDISQDGLPIHAFGCFFLRGMAYFAKREFSSALADFEQAMRLRPPLVKDTGEFRGVLGQLRAETGDREGAAHDFDFAMALKPEDRFIYQTIRDGYGV